MACELSFGRGTTLSRLSAGKLIEANRQAWVTSMCRCTLCQQRDAKPPEPPPRPSERPAVARVTPTELTNTLLLEAKVILREVKGDVMLHSSAFSLANHNINVSRAAALRITAWTSFINLIYRCSKEKKPMSFYWVDGDFWEEKKAKEMFLFFLPSIYSFSDPFYPHKGLTSMQHFLLSY